MARSPLLARSLAWGIVAALQLTSSTVVHAQAKRPPAKPEPPAAPAIKPLVETLSGDARTEYQAGTVLFGDGDFATALQKFKNAHAIQADPRLLYNMASAEKSLRHYAMAAKTLRQYLAASGALIAAEDRRDAEELVKVIDALTLAVTITVSEEGAQVFLDDQLLGVSPLPGGLVVDIGQRKLRAQKDGFRTLILPVQIGPTHAFELQLERQRGRLELKTRAGATVLLDEKPIGTGPIVVADDLPIGGHALRVLAPRMRTYQGEVVLEDGKSRSLDIDLEADPEQFAEIRVGVGCADPRVRSAEEGLTVFLDEATESASPLGARKRVVDDKEVTAFVPFTVSPGSHRVRVRFPGCDPLETAADVGKGGGAVEVKGMLPPEQPWFNGSPAGSPNGFRATAGLTFTKLHFDRLDAFFDKSSPNTNSSADVALAGPSVAVGLQSRWFMSSIEARFLFGGVDDAVPVGDPNALPKPAPGAPTTDGASVTVWDVGVKLGPRIPLNIASLMAGGLAGAGVLHLEPRGQSSPATGAFARGGAFVGIDAQPLCDFSLGLAFSFSGVAVGGPSGDPTTEQAWTIHLGYQPNVLCRRKRAGSYEIHSEAR